MILFITIKITIAMEIEMLIILLIEKHQQQQMDKIITIQPIIIIIILNKIIKTSQQITKIKHLYKLNLFVLYKIKSNSKILSQHFQIVNVLMGLGI